MPMNTWNRTIMNTESISEIARLAMGGTLSFPQMIGRLMDNGVEYYHVDCATRRKSFYSQSGEVFVAAMAFDRLPAIAYNFEIDLLRAAIIDSQRNGQIYGDFIRRAMRAGVQGYFVFLRGRKVTYWGRSGDQHTEWFPGAGPAEIPDIPLGAGFPGDV